MKSALILGLAGSAVAVPSVGNFMEALFGRGNDANHHHHHHPKHSGHPGFGTVSGVPFPFPTAPGAPFPTGTSGAMPFPVPSSDSQEKRDIKVLHIDYELAAKAAPVVKRRDLKYRQLGSSELPSFSLFDPSATPTATQSATGMPTELPTEMPSAPTGTAAPELPTGFPTPPAGGPTAPFPFPSGGAPMPTGAPFPPAGTGAPFPPAGTGFPGMPTTFGTVTRGPKPTAAPDAPGQEDDEFENGNAWLEWVNDLLTGGKGSQE